MQILKHGFYTNPATKQSSQKVNCIALQIMVSSITPVFLRQSNFDQTVLEEALPSPLDCRPLRISVSNKLQPSKYKLINKPSQAHLISVFLWQTNLNQK